MQKKQNIIYKSNVYNLWEEKEAKTYIEKEKLYT